MSARSCDDVRDTYNDLSFRFPSQQKVGGDSKIPSVVCYDGDGNVAGVGSEANPELWEVEGLVRAEWYVLNYLHRCTFERHSIGSSCISGPLIWWPSKDSMRRIYLLFLSQQDDYRYFRGFSEIFVQIDNGLHSRASRAFNV